MSKRYKYIFWDMDGTIINSYPGIIESFDCALAYFGMSEPDVAKKRQVIGPPLRVTFSTLCGMDAEQTEVAVAKYREHYNAGAMFNCSVYDGVEAAMDAFKEAGYIQVITTSKPENMCKQILGKFDLVRKMDEIVGASLDGRIDTKEQVLKEAFHRLDVHEPGKIVLIGDTKYDAIGAKSVGIDCIGITYGFGTREELEQNGAMPVFDTIDDVVHYLIEEV